MPTPVIINATERLFQSITTYDESGVAIEVQNIFKTFADDTGEVVASRAAPVILKDADLDASKTLAEIPTVAEAKKVVDDTPK